MLMQSLAYCCCLLFHCLFLLFVLYPLFHLSQDGIRQSQLGLVWEANFAQMKTLLHLSADILARIASSGLVLFDAVHVGCYLDHLLYHLEHVIQRQVFELSNLKTNLRLKSFASHHDSQEASSANALFEDLPPKADYHQHHHVPTCSCHLGGKHFLHYFSESEKLCSHQHCY